MQQLWGEICNKLVTGQGNDCHAMKRIEIRYKIGCYFLSLEFFLNRQKKGAHLLYKPYILLNLHLLHFLVFIYFNSNFQYSFFLSISIYYNKEIRRIVVPVLQQIWPWSSSKVKVPAWCQLKALVTRIVHAKYQCFIIILQKIWASLSFCGK